jgi:hypothetical protein
VRRDGLGQGRGQGGIGHVTDLEEQGLRADNCA